MRLNLTMLLDRMQDLTILSKNLNKMKTPTLTYPVFYAGDIRMEPDKLYIAKSEQLKPDPILLEQPSLICIGEIPSVYQNGCEYICLPSYTDMVFLFNSLQEAFSIFQNYEETASRFSRQPNAFQSLGEFSFRLFGNPVSLYDSNEKLLMYSYDRNRPPYEKDYMEHFMQPGSYMPDNEYQALHSVSADTYATTGVQLASNTDVFPVNALYVNLKKNDQYLGRILIDDTYHPFADGDYMLLEWLSNLFLQLIISTGTLQFSNNGLLGRMMEELVIYHHPLPPNYEHVLKQAGWQENDHYICACITLPSDQVYGRRLSGDAMYLDTYFSNHCILINDTYIIQVLNLTQCNYSLEAYRNRLNLFLKYNRDCAGCSACFQHLSNVWYCAQQARYAMDLAREGHATEVVLFNDCVLHMMLDNIKQGYTEDFYYSDAIRKLKTYDKENHTDLAQTLRCFLENNMRYSALQESMHIARTTALYRIRRVTEITGLDLDNVDVRLYLLLLFRLEDM